MASEPQPPPVALADLEVAQRIAAGAATGRAADRSPTLEQLLAAFGEPAPTAAARQRVAAALDLAGVRVQPGVADAPPGSRVALETARRGGPSRALLGAGLLVLVLGGAALAATLGGDDGGRLSTLPAGTGPATVETTTTATAPRPRPRTTTTATTPRTRTTTTPGDETGTSTSPRTTTTTGTATDDEDTAAARRTATRRRRARKMAADRRRSAARGERVAVRLTAGRPTYLCAKEPSGRVRFSGTLTGFQLIRTARVLLNIGLGPTTTVTLNGKPVTVSGSPAGVELSAGGAEPLADGERPTC